MNGQDPRDAVALVQRLHELANERRRLEDLQRALRVLERSKFARARELWTDLLALAGVIGKESFIPAARGAGPGAAGSAHATDQLLNLQSANAALVDVITVDRSRAGLDDPYLLWRKKYGPTDADFQRMRNELPALALRPRFSVVMATYNTPERFLRAALDSVRDQIYPDWELCIADDASTSDAVHDVLREYAGLDPRIKVAYRTENGHISRASNSALDLATGEFVALLDHDDLLASNALFEAAVVVNAHPNADVVYSDEDKIDEGGRYFDPFFKPDWAPDSFLSRMYTCHFSVIRRSMIEAVGRFRHEFDGSQDYDLTLRIAERTNRIHHIPKVLYHWRVHPESTAAAGSAKPYAASAAERALSEALDRRGEPGTATVSPDIAGAYIVRYQIRRPGKVSIIMPTRDHGDDVDRALHSIVSNDSYADFEVLLVDNGSRDPASLATFETWRERDARVRVLRYDEPFNFSRLNNAAAREATGEYLLLLNNDTEVITPDWLAAMVEQAQRPSIGAVGAMLLYPDGTIQHAGVVIGVGGVAGHSHKYFPADAPGYFHMLKAVNNYSAVTGACLMVRRTVYFEVGGLDEELAVAFNDVDFCLKLLAAGYRNVCLPHVRLFHYESKSRGHEDSINKQMRFENEKRAMVERWQTTTKSDPYYSPNLTVTAENFALRP